MDTSVNYRDLIKQLLIRYEALFNQQDDPEMADHAIFDEVRDRYMLFRTGWDEAERFRVPALYVRLDNDKIWIEEDWTEEGLTTELLKAGVPKKDIILAFHHPDLQSLTEFAQVS